MKSRNTYKFIIEKTDTGFSAFSEDTPVYTTGKNLTEIQNNILEAMELALDPNQKKLNRGNIELEIDLKQFFEHYRVINSKYLAERIGMNPTLFSQYVTGRKKPSAKQTSKILNGIHEIGRELAELQFIG